ncbi:hypothetical protein JCM9140_4250 [Halalkalibacter wakoensis JCM 9140]|uniref:Uncharacterized protein n=1 Tax=Halalkalibacter wakoensis JCM 9140 TaxID=1236970 RepID=W4Q7K8_9BACI|nr:hypothetical protein [Halalkalibacter wakoensis]GAE28061.1 hypothetical protein JCM9140_4250 [Halalkalibacter wakoensis JCM 9140]
MSTITFAFSIFCGWLIFDFVKHRKFTKESVASSLVIAIVAGLFWWILDWIF